MATIALSKITPKTGRAMNRGLLSSLPREHCSKRNSPTTIQQLQQLSTTTVSMTLSPAVSYHRFCRANNTTPIFRGNNSHSVWPLVVARNRNLNLNLNRHLQYNYWRISVPSTVTSSNKRPFSSSSFLERLKKQAEETAKSVAKHASNKAKETALRATESGKKVVSETLQSTQTAAKHATNEALQSVSKTASEAATKATRATTQKIQSTTQELSRAVSESTTVKSISQTQKAIGSGIEEQRKAVNQTAASVARSSQQLKETMTSTSTKVIRWFWWWSLAAIFVYGVASTLPMAIIKFTIQQKKEATKGNKEEEQQQNQHETAIATEVPSQDAKP